MLKIIAITIVTLILSGCVNSHKKIIVSEIIKKSSTFKKSLNENKFDKAVKAIQEEVSEVGADSVEGRIRELILSQIVIDKMGLRINALLRDNKYNEALNVGKQALKLFPNNELAIKSYKAINQNILYKEYLNFFSVFDNGLNSANSNKLSQLKYLFSKEGINTAQGAFDSIYEGTIFRYLNILAKKNTLKTIMSPNTNVIQAITDILEESNIYSKFSESLQSKLENSTLQKLATKINKSSSALTSLGLIMNANNINIEYDDNYLVFYDENEKKEKYMLNITPVDHYSSDIESLLTSVAGISNVRVTNGKTFIVGTHSQLDLASKILKHFSNKTPELEIEIDILEINKSLLTEIGLKINQMVQFNLYDSYNQNDNSILLSDYRENKNKSEMLKMIFRDPIVQLRMGETDNITRVLTSPTMRVRDNTLVTMHVGNKTPVISSTVSNTGFVSDNVEYIETGIRVGLTPNVISKDEIIIAINLELSNTGARYETAAGTQAPAIGTRLINTVLRVKNGETNNITGVTFSQSSKNKTGLPYVNRLPLVGNLLSSRVDNSSLTEYIVLMKVTILEAPPRIYGNFILEDGADINLIQNQDMNNYQNYQQTQETQENYTNQSQEVIVNNDSGGYNTR